MTVHNEWTRERDYFIRLALLGLYETVEVVSSGTFFIVDNAFIYHRSLGHPEVVWDLDILRHDVKIGLHCYSIRRSY